MQCCVGLTIFHKIFLIFGLSVTIFYGILLVLHNIIIDLKNVMLYGRCHKSFPKSTHSFCNPRILGGFEPFMLIVGGFKRNFLIII
jgi:hypothetical protein